MLLQNTTVNSYSISASKKARCPHRHGLAAPIPKQIVRHGKQLPHCLAAQRQNQINTRCGKQGQQQRICKTKQNRILLFLHYTYYIVRRCV